MSTSIFPIKRGDLVPAITATLLQNGGAIDLTAATSIRFVMRTLSAGLLKVDAAATVVSAVDGTVKYQWVGTDTDTPGIYSIEWRITWAGGDQTIPSAGYDYVRVSGTSGVVYAPPEGSGLVFDGDLATLANGVTAGISRANLAADVAFTGRYVPQSSTPATEIAVNPIFTVTPATRAPWQQVEFGSGPQASGTYDHVMVMGWNARVFDSNGASSTPNVAALLMGFEDGWWDGTNEGAEWWIGAYSPDRSVQLFRPLYTRVITDKVATTIAAGSNGVNTSTFVGAGVLNVAATAKFPTAGTIYVATAGTTATVTFTGRTTTTFTGCTTTAGGGVMSTGGLVNGYTKSAGTIFDIGTADTGAFVVSQGGFTDVFTVSPQIVTYKPLAGSATMIVDGVSYSTVLFRVAGANSFQWFAPSAGQLQLLDKDGRQHILFTQGASSVGAQSDFTSSMIVQGRLRVGPGAALGTNASDGFFYLPTCAGTPTGVPLTQTGSIALIFDTTNNFLYAYNGGWKKTTVFA